ncbi:Uncharacterised protein [Vibrio cholerae]|nr:Uncharacterised protein [Vibrio cholerae]
MCAINLKLQITAIQIVSTQRFNITRQHLLLVLIIRKEVPPCDINVEVKT